MSKKEIVTQEELSLVEKDEKKAQKALQIKTDNDVENAAEELVYLKTSVDALEEKRKEYIGPAQETINRINIDFKKLTEPRKSAVEMLKEAIVTYVAGRYKEMKEKEKEIQTELKDRSLVLDNGLNKVVCSTGELRFRKSTNIKVTNRNNVPEKFWILDKKAIEKAIDSGEDVPGVKIKIEPISGVAVYKNKE